MQAQVFLRVKLLDNRWRDQAGSIIYTKYLAAYFSVAVKILSLALSSLQIKLNTQLSTPLNLTLTPSPSTDLTLTTHNKTKQAKASPKDHTYTSCHPTRHPPPIRHRPSRTPRRLVDISPSSRRPCLSTTWRRLGPSRPPPSGLQLLHPSLSGL